MSDIRLFQYNTQQVTELPPKAAPVEKWLQQLIESNMETFLGVRFLATEFSTSKSHGGRIDSLGLDENNCPVIIEYKRHLNENVINQGLFYLDWLMEHQADFQLLVMERLGREVAGKIDWSAPRLLCIAGDFTRYDEYAVQQINRNIELLRYRLFSEDYLMLELVNRTEESKASRPVVMPNGERSEGHKHSVQQASKDLLSLYEALREYAFSLGEDVQEKELKWYVAFKKLKNFLCVLFNTGKTAPCLVLFLNVDPSKIELEEGFSCDKSNIGHLGTGNLEVRLRNMEDLEKAKPFIEMSYRNS
ncbi:DUF5655 domain-containing protein [Maridesulfovibrio sp.]|uniref:DUF5655 domain-containing protein n=1 Tax=Maridesulfovibrio sp. TaxID=2795000 RepID=UPI002AA7B06D|nr:DUF5655 domain-containing protein [Maridesulfovibrio sp.]